MVSTGELSSRGAKEVIKILSDEKGVAREIAEKNNLMQLSNREELEEIVKKVLDEEDNSAPVQFLVGQAMKKSGGRANPVMLQEIFRSFLDK